MAPPPLSGVVFSRGDSSNGSHGELSRDILLVIVISGTSGLFFFFLMIEVVRVRNLLCHLSLFADDVVNADSWLPSHLFLLSSDNAESGAKRLNHKEIPDIPNI